MKFVLFFISFTFAHTLFYASSVDSAMQQLQAHTTSTVMLEQDTSSDDEGMGNRQNANSELFAEFPETVSIWQQIIGIFGLVLYNFLNYITGGY